jgi:hypothetical protein
MKDGQTVELRDVTVIRQTDLALLCQIGTKPHWIDPSRLQPGSTVRHAGDVGRIVLDREFAIHRGLIPFGSSMGDISRAPRCDSLRSDGAPCAAPRRPGTNFCFAHDPATAQEREAARATAVSARRENVARRQERSKRRF